MILQYLQNHKYYDVEQGHLRKALQSSTKNIKNICLKPSRLNF